MSSYVFHPAVFTDLDHIWESIAENNIDAADRILSEIQETLFHLVSFPQQALGVLISHLVPCVLPPSATT